MVVSRLVFRRDRLSRRRCSSAGSSPCRRCFSSIPARSSICPNSAACWSPGDARNGYFPRRKIIVFVAAVNLSSTGAPPGSIDAGMSQQLRAAPRPIAASRMLIQHRACRRCVVVGHVHFARAVSRQISHVSTVPNSSSPFSARSRAPGTLSRIHLIFVALRSRRPADQARSFRGSVSVLPRPSASPSMILRGPAVTATRWRSQTGSSGFAVPDDSSSRAGW